MIPRVDRVALGYVCEYVFLLRLLALSLILQRSAPTALFTSQR